MHDIYRFQTGMVLVTALIFMSLLTLLVTIGLEAGELQMRMSHNKLQTTQALFVAQFGLQAAYNALQVSGVSCQIPSKSVYELAVKSAAWWHTRIACHGQFADRQYYYVVEPLQIDSCLYIADSRAVQYWRITVRAEKTGTTGAVVILQQVIALPYNKLPPQQCKTARHELKYRLQSWKQLR